jgi:helix-turn-helix protein
VSVKVMSGVWENSKASGTPLLVLLCLADWANDDGECWPSVSSIAKKCRLKDDRHVKRVIHETLERDLGEVIVIQGGGTSSSKGGVRSNRYRIIVHLPADPPIVGPPEPSGDTSTNPLSRPAASQDPRETVVSEALDIIANRRLTKRRASGSPIVSTHAYLKSILNDVTNDMELVDELTKRATGNPTWTAEDLASMFEPVFDPHSAQVILR